MSTLSSPAAPPSRLPGTLLAGARTAGGHGRSATRIVVSTLGAVIGLAGIEHGIGEALQGNVAPTGIVIQSWPDADAFRVLSGEPALTIVPNLLITGILACLISAAFVVWATAFAQRRRGGLVLMLLAVAILLFGGGVEPPLIGLALGAAATRIDAPLAWWRARLPGGARRLLAAWWPWFLGADLLAWLSLVPGLALVGYFFGGEAVPPVFVYALIAAAFGLLPLTVAAGFAHDIQRQIDAPPRPSMSG